jgi:glycosyltransferase involved in cell wall biosynthesis
VSERLAGKHEVTVFTTDPSGELKREEIINGVSVKRFRAFAPGDAYYISPGLLRELRACAFDVVHGHNYHALPLFFSRLANFKKLIITPHYHGHGSTFFRDILIKCYKPFGRTVINDADMVVSVSDYEKRLLMEDFKVEPDRITVIPNGINRNEFRDIKKRAGKGPDEKLIILSVARLEKFKGIQFAISALPLLDERIHLEIVGKGPYKDGLLQLCERLGVTHRVHFYQDLERSVLLEKYLNADLFLLLSKYEGFGIVVAEALASGTPCIVANRSALTQWVDGKNCFGIDYPVNIGSLASLITEVIGQKVSKVDLWDWDDVTKHLELLYLK